MKPIRVKSYTFTPAQLYRLITESIDLYVEYINVHDHIPEAARHATATDAQDGLDAEQELADLGELEITSQVYTPLSAKQKDEKETTE